MSAHRVLRDLLAAFSDVGPGRVTVTATSTGVVLEENKMVQFVVPTWGAADNIIILPSAQPGKIVIIAGAATGGELRSSSPTTIAINGGSGANAESAVAANRMIVAICESDTSWKAFGIASDGTTAGLEAAA
jgi:hypothetical protein